MDYNKIYNQLIEKGRSRGKDVTKFSEKMELHHILPKTMGGSNEDSNLVYLTLREHVIAHMLLCKIYPEAVKLFCALDYMIKTKKYSVSSKQAAYYRDLWYEKRKLIAKDIGKNISKAKKGKKVGPRSEEGRNSWMKHIKYGEENPCFGMSATIETRKKQSAAKLGKKSGPRDESLKGKVSDSNLGHPQGKEVIGPKGELYPTLSDCAKKNNITVGILRNWIKKHPEKGFRFTGNYTSIVSCIRKIKGPDGTIYNSVKEAGEMTGHNPIVIGKWAKNGTHGFSYIN